jgi:hypothetical protein
MTSCPIEAVETHGTCGDSGRLYHNNLLRRQWGGQHLRHQESNKRGLQRHPVCRLKLSLRPAWLDRYGRTCLSILFEDRNINW